jgi:ATP-binding cassette subfamily B protein
VNAPLRQAPQERPAFSKPALGGHQEQDELIFANFDKSVIGRFLGYLRPYPWRLAAILATVLIFIGSQLALPIAIRNAVDSAVGKRGSAPLNLVLWAFLVLVATNAFGSFYQEWITARLAQRVIFSMRRQMFAHLQRVSLGFMDQTQVGRLMSRLQGDVNALQEFLEQAVTAIGDLILLIGITVVLIALDWKLGLLTLTVLPVLIAIRAVWVPRVKITFRQARDASSSVNAALAESINGVRTVQETRRERLNFDLFVERCRHNFAAQIAAARAAQLMIPTVDFLTGVAMAVVVVVGGEAVSHGRLDVGVMVAFIFYVQRFFDPIRTLSMQYTVMQRAMAAGHRIFEVLDVPLSLVDNPNVKAPADWPASIEFKNVTFGYAPGRPVLHGIDLKIEPRQMVALVGPTGSGKSSIAALAHRFYDVWSGQVLVGGVDVRNLPLASLGQNIAMVLQEPFLFTGTILENIRYCSPNVSREQVIEAAKAVRAHDFITQLPKGYDTPLEQRGRNLSMGQRQLLSFARALVVNPKVLILDEATANIDSFTEREIQQALKVLFEGRTSLVIAHRLATVRNADQIIVLQHGRIVEQGDHRSLVKSGGLYSQLHSKNYASFDDLAAG